MTKPLDQRLDDLARATGLVHLTMIDTPRPRNLRWFPMAVLVAMPIGYALMQVVAIRREALFMPAMIGMLLLYGGFAAAIYVRFFGPRMVASHKTPLDEREQLIRARAGAISGTILSLVAVIGCFWFAAAQTFYWWMPHDASGWVWLGLMFEGWLFALPTLIASWLQPPEPDDED